MCTVLWDPLWTNNATCQAKKEAAATRPLATAAVSPEGSQDGAQQAACHQAVALSSAL